VTGGGFDGLHAEIANQIRGRNQLWRWYQPVSRPSRTKLSLDERNPPRVTHRCPYRPDSSRVVALLFVAGQEMGGIESRASNVVKRIVALPEADVRRRLKDIVQRFARRHRDIVAVFSQHAERVSNRLDRKRT